MPPKGTPVWLPFFCADPWKLQRPFFLEYLQVEEKF